MRKFFRRSCAVILAASMVFAQSVTAFAGTDDSNYGPGFTNPKASQEGPGGQTTSTGPATSASSQNAGDVQAADGSAISSGDANQTSEQAAAQAAAEQAAAAEEAAKQAAVTANTPYLQIQVLRPDMTWTDPVVGDGYVDTQNNGFKSICIYLNNIVGNVLYRAYSSNSGWTNWAMNGDHTDLFADGSVVDAIQIRFTGFVGNKFDVNYCATLNDGTTLDWAKNGETAGAIYSGKYMAGFRVSLWGKDGAADSYTRTKPLEAPAADGVQIDSAGNVTYSQGSGAPYTGWGWKNRDRYYFVEGQAVKGWQYIDGYKYYFGEDGKVVTDLEPVLGAKGPYLIRINKQMNTTTIYAKDGANGYIIPYKVFLCSTGDDTPLGTFKTPEKYRWRLMNSGVYCQYATRLGPGLSILLHSIIYERPDINTLKPETYNFQGVVRSAGCIRFLSGDAKWIYDNCALGTTVEVYNSSVPGPYDRPAIEQTISMDQHWDPTDPVAVAQHQ